MRHVRQEPEEATHHERWLVSYADLMTLLFALFVVLFASSHHDQQSLQKVSAAVQEGFQTLEAFPPAHPPSSRDGAANPRRGIDPAELHAKLNRALGKEIEKQEIALRTTPEGFVISLHELGFFNSGQAQLLPGAADKIKNIAAVLAEYGLDMRVEGHSDDVPIHNAQFPSNWELSTARASAVAMMLIQDAGCDPRRLSIAGYGEYHPAASNDTPEGRRANRRVDIVIVSPNRPLQAQ
jgi:chemotaxis protein MotB